MHIIVSQLLDDLPTWLKGTIRKSLGLWQVRLSVDQAKDVARQQCLSMAFSAEDPVLTWEGIRHFLIKFNARCKPGGPWVWVHMGTGTVCRIWYGGEYQEIAKDGSGQGQTAVGSSSDSPGVPHVDAQGKTEMRELIDEALSYWEAQRLNCRPGNVPTDMQTGQVEGDWKYWRAIASKVTQEDITELEEYLGVSFPPSYIELLTHRHFIELQMGEISFFAHPSSGWRASITDAIFGGYPRELLIDKGYLPFANCSDWGLWCFGVKERRADGEYPIYQWDHERPEEFAKVADHLFSGLSEQWKQSRQQE